MTTEKADLPGRLLVFDIFVANTVQHVFKHVSTLEYFGQTHPTRTLPKLKFHRRCSGHVM